MGYDFIMDFIACNAMNLRYIFPCFIVQIIYLPFTVHIKPIKHCDDIYNILFTLSSFDNHESGYILRKKNAPS